MADKPFELRVEPDKSSAFALSLYRVPARGENANGSGEECHAVVWVHGTPMRAVMDQVRRSQRAMRCLLAIE